MFQKYKYVLAVYEERSFTNAAKRLFISQPSLSVAIRNLEKEIGAPLFERYTSEIKPTEIGQAYIEAAQKMQLADNEFGQKLAEINGLQTGKLVVGGSNYVSSDVLPLIISQFRSNYPGVEITLTEANSVHLKEMLNNEEVDVVIDNSGDLSEGHEMYPLINEQIMLCVPISCPVNKSLKKFQISPEQIYDDPTSIRAVPAVEISAFREERFVLLKSGNNMHTKAQMIFEDSGVTPNVVFRVDQLNISFALAESGLGACFVTDTFFKYRKHVSNVVLYKLDHRLASRVLHVVYKKGRYCTRAMSEFIRITQEMIGETSAVDEC